MLQFDAETTRLLNIAYQGADITRRRQVSFDALRPVGGETIVDIGCGNGLLTQELGRGVGATGRIIGIDPSPDMRDAAKARCAEFDWVSVLDGTAYALPLHADSADKAVSVQVFEYLDDIPGAVAEVLRILRPGGRLVVGDTHMGSLVWFTEDQARMDRLITAWDAHFTEAAVPALLPAILSGAGFEVEAVTPVTFCDHTLKPDGFAAIFMRLVARYATDTGQVPEEDVAAWTAEQEALAAAGRFFFSISHFVVSARKP